MSSTGQTPALSPPDHAFASRIRGFRLEAKKSQDSEAATDAPFA
jgi:hypothetical protein